MRVIREYITLRDEKSFVTLSKEAALAVFLHIEELGELAEEITKKPASKHEEYTYD